MNWTHTRINMVLCTLVLTLTVACSEQVEVPSVDGASSAPRIVLSPGGVNGITTETAFSVEAIRHSFPRRDVVREMRTTEGEAYPVIAVRDGQQILLAIIPNGDRVGSVVVQSDQVIIEFGHSIGSQFKDIYKNYSGTECRPGSEEMSGRVLCIAPDLESFTYVFEGQWDRPDGELPPTSRLSQWRLFQIVWMPRVVNAENLRLNPESATPKPSFDCRMATGSVENLVCANHELAELDRTLSALYERVNQSLDSDGHRQLRASQRGWIKGRNDCWKAMEVSVADCVAAAYSARIDEVERLLKKRN